MTLVPIAFIFMNEIAAFFVHCTNESATGSPNCNACDLMQCAIVSKHERRN
jgi:hypothetical protein